MNTPRSKPPVRFGQFTRKWNPTPDGHYRQGLYVESIVNGVGRIVTTFPILEQGMIAVLEDLLGGNAPARQVFFSIVNQKTRIDVMRSLLEHSSINKDKSIWYDLVIDEFKAVSVMRNEYAHGLWWTLDKTRAFISKDEATSVAMGQWREVTAQELEKAYDRMVKLNSELWKFQTERLEKIPQLHEPTASEQSHAIEDAPASTGADTGDEAP